MAIANCNSDDLFIRQAEPSDAEKAAPLILSSGEKAFKYVFCTDNDRQPLVFLAKSFVKEGSEFSYRNHFVMCKENTVIGIGALRYKEQSTRMTIKAVQRIFADYTWKAPVVIKHGWDTEQVIEVPKDTATGYIYHLAFTESERGKGYGTKLLEFLEKKMKECGCTSSSLDVSSENHRAEKFYAKHGYVVKQIKSNNSLVSEYGAVVPHKRMEKLIS